MNAAVKISEQDILEILNIDVNEEIELKSVIDKFNQGVHEFRQVIESMNVIPAFSTSLGKDSSCTLLIGLEAYRQSIAEGKIEAERPFIVSTVNTKADAIAMNLYVSYAKKRVEEYAKSINVNLFYDIVTPPLNDEYFIKFCGGQKLLSSAKRHGDCSIILKVNPSEKYIKNIVERFKTDPAMEKYKDFKLLSCVGSRTEESGRRSKNMQKQKISDKSIQDVQAELEEVSLSGQRSKIYKYAPIRDWSTDNVFNMLRLAGTTPLTKPPAGASVIPAFLSDFGILLEIYGNGADTCNIVIGQTAGTNCNGKSRYGCTICTMISTIDKSSTSLSRLQRWRSIGVEDALRVRDWMHRLSESLDARAVDFSGYSRVALQPNILKISNLEKMVRYASQLTLDSIRVANEFKKAVQEGRIDEHPAIIDIDNDMNMAPKTKKAFKQMYIEGVQDPKNLNYLFSEVHALLLSFRWSIDGLGSAPYRPLHIWESLKKSKQSWIPYPKLNQELLDAGIPLIDDELKELPEAIMVRTLKDEDPVQFAKTPINIVSLWSKPFDYSELFEEDRNCSASRVADSVTNFEVTYTQSYINQGVNVMPGEPKIKSLKLAGKIASIDVVDTLLSSGLADEIETLFFDKVDYIQQKHGIISDDMAMFSSEYCNDLEKAMSGVLTIKRGIKFLQEKKLHSGYSNQMRKVTAKLQFTKRVTKMVGGKVRKGNTRLAFYPSHFDSKLYEASLEEKSLHVPNFESHIEKNVTTHLSKTEMNMQLEQIENIDIDLEKLQLWGDMGGKQAALDAHDQFLNRIIKKRHLLKLNKYNVRDYGGTFVAEDLLANGVVSIAKTYWSQLHAILKRTQVFNSLGLFSFQSMPYRKLIKDERFITMSQHRIDKAQVIQEVRKLRNSQRKDVKSFIEMPRSHQAMALVEVFKANISTVENAVIESSKVLTGKNLATTMRLRFHTEDVSVAEQASTYKLWLALTFGTDIDVNTLMDMCLTSKQARLLRSNPNAYLRASEHVECVAANIVEKLKNEMSVWGAFMESVKALIPVEFHNHSVSDFKALACNSSPLCEKDVLEYWNPSHAVFERTIEKALGEFENVQEVLGKLIVKLDNLSSHAKRKAISKMSLEDKLSMFKRRA